MSKRQKFVNSVIHIIAHNRDGSYRTRDDRQKYLIKMANDLYKDGFQFDILNQNIFGTSSTNGKKKSHPAR